MQTQPADSGQAGVELSVQLRFTAVTVRFAYRLSMLLNLSLSMKP